MKSQQHLTEEAPMTTAHDLARWAHELNQLHTRIAPRFVRPEPRRRVLAYLQGVLSPVGRKNGWHLAEQAREATPYGMQRLLNSAVWEADLVRDDLRAYVIEQLGTQHAILVIDETSFPKRGSHSAGVQKQYCGTTGQVENCQVGVFLSYVTPSGHALIDRELYLPRSWIEDPERSHAAGIPPTTPFKTKPELAIRMMERLLQAHIPIDWIVADTVYGGNLDLRRWVEGQRVRCVLAVACDEPIGLQTPDGQRRMVAVSEVAGLMLHGSASA